MTTPQTAQALADDILAAINELADGDKYPDLIDAVQGLAALATQTDTERANWKRWCEQAEAATKAEAPAAPAQAPHWFSYGLHCARQVDAANQRCAELQSKLDAALAATPAQTVAPAQANAADDLIHRLHAEANKADDVHADLMREAAEALAAKPAPVVQPLTDEQCMRLLKFGTDSVAIGAGGAGDRR